MSQWTHVAGTIRFDDFSMITGESSYPDLGLTCNFDSTQEEWDACTVPCGSEGSLSYYVYINGDESSVAKYVVSIWGDLRDYADKDEIMAYFDQIVKDKHIRQGCYTIYVEPHIHMTFVYDGKKGKFTRLYI